MTKIPVEDRLDIQELVARYAFRCDTGRYTEVGELFADNGTWDESVIGLPPSSGPEAINQVFAAAGEALEYLIHLCSNHQITTHDGTTASGTTHLHAEGVFNASHFRILGYYTDDYIKTPNGWRFQSRTLIEIAPTTGLDTAPAQAN